MSTIHLLPAPSDRDRRPAPAPPPAGLEIEGSIARLARALARADLAACLTVAGDDVRVGGCDPAPTDGPTVRRLAACTGRLGRGRVVDRLVSGDLAWALTVPPDGFAHAALIGAPSRHPAGRLLVIANRDRRRPFGERELCTAAAFAGQMARLLAASGLTAWPADEAPRRKI
jgi:hypothetical protein